MKHLLLTTKKAVAIAALAALMPLHSHAETPIAAADISERALLQTLPGFTGAQAVVNGIALHYVIGGKGEPLVLLPGWPETWWGYHKIMPELAKHYTVIAVDMRGQGASGRPTYGYDKKTMAADILGLVHQLGYSSAHIAGHDIGSHVAYSYAANFPQATRKLVLMDVAPSTESMLKLPMLPPLGTFGDKIDADHAYLWWFAFHQVKGLPEQLLAGRVRLEQEWFYHYMAVHEEALDARDRAVYEAAYNSADAIRASNGWYQTFTQDIIDDRDYQPLTMPVLALGAPGFKRLKAVMEQKARRLTAVRIGDSGHFVQEEQPAQVVDAMLRFLAADQP